MDKLLTRKNHRLKEYNYSNNGYYFVTVCSKNRENIFGEYNKNVGVAHVPVRNNIQLSIIGEIIQNQWVNIKNNYDNVELDEYIIMPNHIHGILIINNRAQTSGAPTLSKIIRSFKSKTSMGYLNYLKHKKVELSVQIWQRSFYDHVIRNEHSLNIVRKYISDNSKNWEKDVDNIFDL